MKKLQVQKTAKRNIYIHNDISNTAHHLKKRVEEMEATGNREGVALDITACLILLAFTFESRLNFVGAQKVTGWKERQGFDTKLQIVLKTLKLEPDYSVRPYSSVNKLKNFRDTIAHGKPSSVEVDETVDFHPGADYGDFDLRAPWEDFLNATFMRECSDDIDEIWKEWLATAEIEVHQTLTQGEFSVTLIEQPSGFDV